LCAAQTAPATLAGEANVSEFEEKLRAKLDKMAPRGILFVYTRRVKCEQKWLNGAIASV
jgi:hypothetical protein